MWSFLQLREGCEGPRRIHKAVESARAALSLLNGTGAKAKKLRKKSKEVKKDATAKVQDSKSDAKEAEDAPEADDEMKAGFLGDLEKAKQSQRTAKGAMIVDAKKMFAFYSNLLLRRVSMLGTRLSASRWKVTRTSTYKVTPWKAQGECLASCLTIA
jgi:hypothetical protein